MAFASPSQASTMNERFLALGVANDPHFLRCWGIQECRGCLRQADCSWCPFSGTCVPNSHSVQFLAPVWEGDTTCPHWAERWEIRTRPLGCHVSTITTLTSLVTIACTLLFVFLIWLAGVATRRLVAFNTKQPGWRKVWRYDGLRRLRRVFGGLGAQTRTERDQEHELLLPSTRSVEPP
ncbi:hypothetical protein GGR58DRAFT_87177 [Xylaria digitata]|nr:hypothetical protein GGR58DRAFT_87177 [Xylaria digitata]